MHETAQPKPDCDLQTHETVEKVVSPNHTLRTLEGEYSGWGRRLLPEEVSSEPGPEGRAGIDGVAGALQAGDKLQMPRL